MIYDGDCGFCGRWIQRWKRTTADRVEYLPFQDPSIAARFPELPREAFERSVHLVEPDGRVYRGAEAVFRSLASPSKFAWLLWTYEKIPGVAPLAEWGYRRVASNRVFLSAVSKRF